MTSSRLSLVERAAEIYDFQSGLPVRADAGTLPPRRAEAAARPEPAPTAVKPAAEAAPRAESAGRPVRHQGVELDRQKLAANGILMPDSEGPGGFAEEIRLVKRRLLSAIDARSAAGDPRARIVLLASAQPGDGKTFMAANLAFSIAGEAERRVLLIDGDNAKPELMGRIGVDEGRGLADALTDRAVDPEALVLDTDLDGLSLLRAGRRERNLPELLASGRTGQVLERLLAADPRRILIIDSPAALAASAAAVLASHAGQGLVVVRADRTSEADLNETLDLLSTCGNLSLLLNASAFQAGGRRFGRYEEYP